MSTSAQHQEPGQGTVSDGVATTHGTYNAVAVFLALIVMAALVYGLAQTALKASALFTDL